MACKQTLRTFDGICGRECVYNKCLAGKKVAVCWNTTASTGCCLNWQVAREFDSNEKLQIIRTFALKTGRKGIHAPFGPVQHNLVVTMCVWQLLSKGTLIYTRQWYQNYCSSSPPSVRAVYVGRCLSLLFWPAARDPRTTVDSQKQKNNRRAPDKSSSRADLLLVHMPHFPPPVFSFRVYLTIPPPSGLRAGEWKKKEKEKRANNTFA